MAARIEKSPSSQETTLSAADRRELLATISTFTARDRLGILMHPSLQEYVPYLLLNRLMQLWSTPEVRPSQKNQISKMVSLGIKQTPVNLPPGIQSFDEFLEFLADEIPEELAVVADFPPDLKGMPLPWKQALTDWRKANKQLLGE